MTYKNLSETLGVYNIHPILYGSVGASIYLGSFKQFNDLDLLIEDQWLANKWDKFKSIMLKEGFYVFDEKEHEFENHQNLRVAFAAHSVLIRDKIANLTTDIVSVNSQGFDVHTLTPKGFLKAYEFSVKDGYRAKQRGKKDAETVKLLKDHLALNT